MVKRRHNGKPSSHHQSGSARHQQSVSKDRKDKPLAKKTLAIPSSLPRHPKGRARHLAAWCVEQVLFDHRALLTLWPLIDKEQADRALIRSIVFATLRHLGQLRALLASRLKTPLSYGNRATEARLLTALAELFYLDNSPRPMVVTSAVDSAPSPLKNMVNAVLRRTAEEEDDSRALLNKTNALPAWLRERWVKCYGKTITNAMVEMFQNIPPLDLTLLNDADGGGSIAPWSLRVHSGGNPYDVPVFAKGQAIVQDLAASLPIAMLGTIKGMRVLDLCAAPGGKTMQLATAGADVTAVDNSAQRLTRLNDNLKRTQLHAKVIHADALAYQDSQGFDIVVLDAPCAATGTIRRHPDIPFLRKAKTMLSYVELQGRMLDMAVDLVKPGGRLLYAVCSLEPEECEQQISAFLMRKAGVRRAKQLAPPPLGLEMTRTKAGFLRTLPSMCAEQGGMDGFFAAVLEKSYEQP